MKLKIKELKALIETFISGPLGTMDTSDPYEKLHQDIKDKLGELGSRENPPVSSRGYFLKFRNDPAMLAQINNLNDALISDEQTYEFSDYDDALATPSGEEVSRQIDAFENPYKTYYSFDNIINYFKNNIPDLVMRSKTPHQSYMSGPGKTYIKSHTFYSGDKNGLSQLKKALHLGGFRIINDKPKFSGQGGMFKVTMPSKKYNIPKSFVGKFAFVALEPDNSN